VQQLQWEEQAKDGDNIKDGCRGYDRNEKEAGKEQGRGKRGKIILEATIRNGL
jgi:hypothetical protein